MVGCENDERFAGGRQRARAAARRRRWRPRSPPLRCADRRDATPCRGRTVRVDIGGTRRVPRLRYAGGLPSRWHHIADEVRLGACIRVIASARKISGSITYEGTPRSRRRAWIEGTSRNAVDRHGSSRTIRAADRGSPPRMACHLLELFQPYEVGMLPCSSGVRAVLIVVLAPLWWTGERVVASMAAPPRAGGTFEQLGNERHVRRARGTSQAATSRGPSARMTTTMLHALSQRRGRALSAAARRSGVARPSTSSTVAGRLRRPRRR